MNIYNSQIEDIDSIFELYEIATNFQNKKSMVAWPKFKRELVQKEISENRQWKLIIDQQIACIWATTDSDPQIWGCLLYTSPSPRDGLLSRMPSSA